MKLDAFIIDQGHIDIRSAPLERDWMEATDQRFAYRCLPLNIANGHGWEILCPSGFSATWSGEARNEAIHIEPDAKTAAPAVSHFGHGVLTFHVRALFRTAPGFDLMVQGPINRPKDGIYALSAVVESDWLPFSFTMNWVFTRANEILRFEKGEPFCHLYPVRRGEIESVNPELRHLDSEPELKARYDEWSASRSKFNADLASGDPAAVKAGWQKNYLKGTDASGHESVDESHRTRLRVKEFKQKKSESQQKRLGRPQILIKTT